ncbi:hypothetical protein CDAR_491341 [Caerostris darwini]|uniref:Uncharacterized protein n=1 Tax=Caerostris darwini TaxID=1538125 RepID=A0AAV4X8C2_9ARAC|nr:hypothetical protein CDAR_491341 [Caerostris darwini]
MCQRITSCINHSPRPFAQQVLSKFLTTTNHRIKIPLEATYKSHQTKKLKQESNGYLSLETESQIAAKLDTLFTGYRKERRFKTDTIMSAKNENIALGSMKYPAAGSLGKTILIDLRTRTGAA